MTAFKDWLNGLTSKTTPVDADEVYVRDSSGTPSSKKLTWANLKATLADTFLSLTGGTIASGTKTASDPALTVTQTWNNAAIDFVGKTTGITNTASGVGSVIERWQVGGLNSLQLTWRAFTFGDINSYGGVKDGLSSDAGLVIHGNNAYANSDTAGRGAVVRGPDFWFNKDGFIGFADLAAYTVQTVIRSDAANTLAQRNGTNAQTFRLYNTYTDASNYERGFMRWNSNVLEIGAEAAGTGTARNISLLTTGDFRVGDNGGYPWFYSTSGVFKLRGDSPLAWSSVGNNASGSADTSLSRSEAGVLALKNGSTGGAAFEFVEVTAPAAPATNGVRIYAEDNGSGKTRLMALFATGAAVQIAIEP